MQIETYTLNVITMLAFSKSAIHFPIALLLLFGFGQPAQGNPTDPANPDSSSQALSQSLTELGIQVATSPNPKLAKALLERAIQIAEAIQPLTQRSQALLTIARRLREVNQTTRSQQLIERVIQLALDRASEPVQNEYDKDRQQEDLAIISAQLAEVGQVDRALQFVRTKISLKLRKGQALNRIAVAIAHQGKTQQARELLSEAVRSVKGETGDYAYESNGSCGNEKFAIFSEIAKSLSLVSELDQALQVAETIWGCNSASGDSAQYYQAWAYLGILSNLGTVEQLQQTWNSAKRMPQAPNISGDPAERLMTWHKIAEKLIDLGEIPLALSITTQLSTLSRIKDETRMYIYPEFLAETGQENLQKIALKLAQKQQFEAALQVTQLLANASTRKDIARKEIAGQLAHTRQLDKALQVANSISDATIKTRTNLAIVENLQKIGLTTQANALFEKLIPVLTPESAPELVAIGQRDRALNLIAKLDEQSDAQGQILVETAMKFVELKQLESVLKLSSQLKEDRNRHPLLLAIAVQQVKLGQLDQALELALSLKNSGLWDLPPQRDRLLASIAHGFAQSGQSEKARQAAEEISEDLAKVAVISELALQK
jgi:tetratricopeptide (TPR) repeat protein